jgi:FkbM family methyltransferase
VASISIHRFISEKEDDKMSLIDRILTEPEFQSAPPVLVDVGAAGGVPSAWKRIARYSIVVAFEPDARESAPLTGAQQQFKRWIYVPAIVTQNLPTGGKTILYLTRSPQCSSTLQPQSVALKQWAFASFFDVLGQQEFPVTTLQIALQAHGLTSPDWLKCDTQGTDLRLFMSLPVEVRRRVLAVEFEPGLIDAYEGEDALSQILETMRNERYLLTDFSIQKTPLACDGQHNSGWYRRLAPGVPGWGNLRYLHWFGSGAPAPDRRTLLLLWVLATLHDQPAYAYNLAGEGVGSYGGGLFLEMQRASLRQLRFSMVARLPLWILHRLFVR